MDDYSSYHHTRPTEPLGSSLTRNSYYSHHSVAPSRNSWVYDHNENPPGPPAPQPIDYPSPVQTVQPLPPSGSHLRNPHPHPLHVVNRTPMSEEGEDYMHAGEAIPRPRKKKSLVGGFVKGIRKLPKAIFRRGGSSTPQNRSQASLTNDTEDFDGATVTYGMSAGNMPPGYSSAPATPITEPAPPRSNAYRHRPTAVSPIPESPTPDVVRLSDVPQRDSIRNDVPGGFDPGPSGSQLFAPPGHRFIENLQSEGSYPDPVERTTVMMYNDSEAQPYNRNSRGPLPTPPVHAQQVSSPGLSYVSESLAPIASLTPLRPASFHSSQVPFQPQPQVPVEIPRISSESTLSQKTPQIRPQPRVPPPSLIPGALHSSSHTPSPAPPTEAQHQDHVQPPLQQEIPRPDPQPVLQHAEPAQTEPPVQSPVDANPSLASDYRGMVPETPPSSRALLAARHVRSYYDPSFSSDLSPVERFFKTLYRMPWVSHERVTVDYKPGVGLGHMKKKKTKPMTSWYRSMLAGSKRSSASLDLLSSGNRTATDTTSLRMAVAAAIGSPQSGARHSGRSSEDRDKVHRHHHHHHHHHRHQHSSHHHRHHEKNNHSRRRHTAASGDTTDTDADEKYSNPLLSPLPFPVPYSPYPFPAFPPFQVAPAPIPAQVPNPPKQAGNVSSPIPPGGQPPPQAVMYSPAGFTSYQPMVAPAPVYVLQTPPSPQVNAPATAPQGQQPAQPAPAPPGVVYMPAIPGAFA
ncbi:hypothetical protein CVT26_014413 [Gymnopilus dilepis]|uniref:Uncharacterized protein n=1 Tax=Gymnopilus dilepis TaxID=231916 RepID=A0A409Y7C8_9AGAR|nr:hypothetical protein CVT26_014413 [Gymnopilus dilepis]